MTLSILESRELKVAALTSTESDIKVDWKTKIQLKFKYYYVYTLSFWRQVCRLSK